MTQPNGRPVKASDEMRASFERDYSELFNERMGRDPDERMKAEDMESMRGELGDYRDYAFVHGCWMGYVLAHKNKEII